MTPIHTRISIGVAKPLRFLHVTDSHLISADERDSERKRELARQRREAYYKHGFDCCRRGLDAALDYARRQNELVLHTGDLIDFVSYRNLELAREKLSSVDCFFAAGNHEFSKYVGEAQEDEAYKLDSLPLVAPAFPNDLRFAARLAGGVANSEVWTQMFADVMQCPVEIADVGETGAMGCAMSAAVGVGDYADLAAAAAGMTRIRQRVEPRMEYAGIYARKYELYCRAVVALEPVWEELAAGRRQ